MPRWSPNQRDSNKGQDCDGQDRDEQGCDEQDCDGVSVRAQPQFIPR
jgi:hypothetical protein